MSDRPRRNGKKSAFAYNLLDELIMTACDPCSLCHRPLLADHVLGDETIALLKKLVHYVKFAQFFVASYVWICA